MTESVTDVAVGQRLAAILDEVTNGADWLAEIATPNWGRNHGWTNYVPSEIQGLWLVLPLESRMVAFFLATDLAGREDLG